jgi:excisionase family DNA binding protein
VSISTLFPTRRLITVKEAAERMAVSDRTVRNMIRDGRITGYRTDGPGSAIRLDPEELVAWLDADPREAA